MFSEAFHIHYHGFRYCYDTTSLLKFVSVMRALFVACIFLGCFGSIFASSEVEGVNGGQVAKSGVSELLDIFEVQAPLRSSYGGAACQQVIVEHEFAASYGTPFLGMHFQDHPCSKPAGG